MTKQQIAIQQQAAQLGARRGEDRRRALPALAVIAAEAAAKGDIEPTDAPAIFMAYYQGVSPDRRNVDEMSPTIKVQTSKLRAIIKAAQPRLLAKVIEFHRKADPGQRATLYGAMVDCCRLVNQGLVPTDGKLKMLVRKH